jgi:hypothetical protein
MAAVSSVAGIRLSLVTNWLRYLGWRENFR